MGEDSFDQSYEDYKELKKKADLKLLNRRGKVNSFEMDLLFNELQ